MRKHNGFTLIELLVTVAIVGVVLTVAIPRIESILGLNLKSSARKLSLAVKFVYNESIMTNKLHRMVFDFEKNNFFVETYTGKSTAILDLSNDDSSADESDEKKKSPFQKYQGNIGIPNDLPSGSKFKSIYKFTDGKEYSKGLASIYFFPHGQVEQALIKVQDSTGDVVYTISISPLNGNAMVVDKDVDPNELEK